MSLQPAKALYRGKDRPHRRFPRFRCEFPVTVTLFSGEAHRRLDGRCKDLSAAGIGILIAEEISQGEVASLVFSLPDQSLPDQPQLWTVRAVLRHRRGYHYGFEFLSLSSQQSKTLADYFPRLKRADSD
jgi:c-di-GMP-binding flagellar brake protein YcgR